MNQKTKSRHEVYLERLVENMSDGKERSGKECHHFIDTPRARDTNRVMGRLKIALVERRQIPWKLVKRKAGKEVFWRLVPKRKLKR